MTELRINDELVQWAVDGAAVSADTALTALAEGRPLLLLMHGYGSFEGDLIGLAPRLPGTFVCASPRAPLTAPPPVVNGYSWWNLSFAPDGTVVQRHAPERFVESDEYAAAVCVLEWLDRLDAQVRERNAGGSGGTGGGTGTGLGTVVPFGFSQGGCQVTSLLRLHPERFACGVNCSGFIASGSFDGDAELASVRPPMFWGRDDADPIIDRSRIDALSAWAPEHTELEARLYDGILHGIGLDEIEDITAFLQRNVPDLSGAAS